MSLNFAAIAPHPPIILPEIGSKEDLQKVLSTTSALKRLGYIFNQAEIDTLIVISPHSTIYPDQFSVCAMKKIFGSMAAFNAPEVILEYSNNLDIVEGIVKVSQNNNLDVLTYNNDGEFFEMDHGLMVPLYYLSGANENSFKVVPLAYSSMDKGTHFSFGQVLQEVAEKYKGRVGILASGDLSHRLIAGPSGQYSPIGKKFDQKLVEDLVNFRTKEIIYYDDEFIEEAGECGFRSILILLGALDNKKFKPDILSYEGPFGVGYLVANFKLTEN